MYESPRVSLLIPESEDALTDLLAESNDQSETDNEVSIGDLIGSLGLL